MDFPPPEHWGKDRLTGFFDTVFQNGFAALQRKSDFIAKAREIDTLFEEMLDETKSNPSIGQVDMGAHPNMRALYAATEFNDVSDGKRLDFHYCSVNNNAQDASRRVNLQVGVCALKIFERIWKLRFEISGLSDKIGRSSMGL